MIWRSATSTRDPNPGTPPPATIANPNLQVAIPFNNCDIPSVSAVNIRIFDVDPANQFQIALHSQFVIGPGTLSFSRRSRRWICKAARCSSGRHRK